MNKNKGTTFLLIVVLALVAVLGAVTVGIIIKNNKKDDTSVTEQATLKLKKGYGAITGYIVDGGNYAVSDENEITSGAVTNAKLTVNNAKNGNEIPGNFSTDKKGYFIVEVPEGSYKISVNAEGYDPYTLPETFEVKDQKETRIEEVVKLTKSAEEKALNASETEMAELKKMLKLILNCNVEFDPNHSNAGDEVAGILFRYPLDTLLDYYNVSSEYATLEQFIEYTIYDGKEIDDIQTNLFGIAPNHSGKEEVWYYKDGKYYERSPGMGGPPERQIEFLETTPDANKNYTIKARARNDYNNYFDMDGYSDYEYYTVKAKLLDIDGRHQWRILKISFNGTKPEQTTSTTAPVTKATDGYKEAYRKVLLDYINESGNQGVESDACFGLVYIDGDDIPELVITPGFYHAASAKTYTYDDSKAVYIGDFGSWGQFAYVERKSIIVYGFMGQGHESIGVYRINGNQSELIWSAENDAGRVGEDEATWEVNGVVVSKEEYDRLYDENVPDNSVLTPSPGEPGAYSLDRATIMSF